MPLTTQDPPMQHPPERNWLLRKLVLASFVPQLRLLLIGVFCFFFFCQGNRADLHLRPQITVNLKGFVWDEFSKRIIGAETNNGGHFVKVDPETGIIEAGPESPLEVAPMASNGR